MTEEHKTKIRHFISKPLMYVYELEKKQVVAFVTGLETADNSLDLQRKLSELLEAKKELKWMVGVGHDRLKSTPTEKQSNGGKDSRF